MNAARRFRTDVLIIGAGGAGLRSALAAANAGSQVLLLNKGPVARSGITLTAAGGFQAPLYPEDSQELYFRDTVTAGYGLGDQNLVKVLAENASTAARDAELYGASFARYPDGKFILRRLAGQSHPRQLSFQGGGLGLVSALAKVAQQNNNITMVDDFYVTGLLENKSAGQVLATGAFGVNLKTGEFIRIDAKAVVMATGGCQSLWEISDCPDGTVGDGIIYAYRIGAELVDMEMVLFYPSVIVWPPSLRGAFVHYEYLDSNILDGNIYDKRGNTIFPKPLPLRDEAMRVITKVINDGRGTSHGGLYWYIGDSPKDPEVIQKTLNVAQYHYIRANGIVPEKDKVEVAPGAHYLMGGIAVDANCRTSVRGLYATPECAGNFDGANRLPGNGLTATQVFGTRAGLYAHDWAKTNPLCESDPTAVEREMERVAGRIQDRADGIQRIMPLKANLKAAVQKYAAVNRDKTGLKRLLHIAGEIQSELAQVKVPPITVYNQALIDVLQMEIMCEAARLSAGCALLRQESRGHHFRVDFPERDDTNWRKHTKVVQGADGPQYGTRPVIMI